MDSVKQEVEQINDYLINIRRTIHENPELGFLEFKTAELICSELDKIGISYKKGIARTGIVATLEGSEGPGKTLLIRADMDALPLDEETNLSFKSKNEGIFHACGHDSHVSCLLGTAKLLKEKKFKGTVKFVFQPSEEGSLVLDPEISNGGALPMIKEGAVSVEELDGVLALHVISGPREEDKVGIIGVKDGPFTGSADEYYITIKGKGGHASAPHTAVDPVYIASQVNIAIQGYLSRAIDPMEPRVFTVGKIVGGSRHNIIAETCKMDGTLRTLNEEIREKINLELPETIKNIARSFGGDAEVKIHKGYPVGVNDQLINDHIRKSVIELYGKESLFELPKAQLGAEDFFEFGFKNKVPIAMFWLGGANPDKGMIHSNHSSFFDYDEQALIIGTSILTSTALSFLND